MLRHQPRQYRLAFRRRLQERAGRQCDSGLPHAHGRRGALHDQFAVAREPRQPMGVGKARERCRVARAERPGAAHIDVEPGIGCGDLDVERLPRTDGFRDGPCGGQRTVKRWRQHRATVDADDLMRTKGRKADFQHAMRRAPRVEHGAAPPLPVRVDQVADRRIEPRLPKRLDNEAAFPVAVARKVPVLGLAAAADRRSADRPAAMRSGLALSTRSRCRRSGWPETGSTSTISPGSV